MNSDHGVRISVVEDQRRWREVPFCVARMVRSKEAGVGVSLHHHEAKERFQGQWEERGLLIPDSGLNDCGQ